jgi:LysR family glycine cleavage system transcriptional activator
MEHRQSFRALEAFEAVSRHMSVSKAATELGVTQSAVSHRIRLLSDLIGERLVQKLGRGIALTEAGDRLARKLQTAFAEIDRSVSEAIGGTRDTVRLAVCSSFGPGWLVPRLREFYAMNPDFDLQLCMYARDPVLTDTVADAFVTTFPTEKGFFSFLLWPERLVPVVGTGMPGSNAEPALITTDLQRGRVGADWKTHEAIGGRELTTPPGGRWLFASHYLVALEMVRAGLGAALVPDFLVSREVSSGKLALLDDISIPTRQDYYLCVKETRRKEPGLDALIRWFRSQIARREELDVDAKVLFK